MEGLFRPGEIAVPFDLDIVLPAVVRLHTPIYFHITVLERGEEAARLRLDFTRRRLFLREGAVLWQVVLTVADLEALRARAAGQGGEAERGAALAVGGYEIVRAVDGVATFPAFAVATMEGDGAGSLISPRGDLLTCYHVAREEVDGQQRAFGQTAVPGQSLPCRFLAARTADGQPLPGLELAAHVAPEEWRAGLDAALLRLPGRPSAVLPVATAPPRIGAPVWLVGFPMRTRRDPARLAAVGYTDAGHDLRLSAGAVTAWPTDHTFVVDADGTSGNSGGPALNERGELVGLVWNVHPATEANQRSVAFTGGMVCVWAGAALTRLG